MVQNSQRWAGRAMLHGELELGAGTWFPWHEHEHEHHQLAWAAEGMITVTIGDAHWVLPPTRALWVPAGTRHRTGARARALMRGIYAEPEGCPVRWPEPQLVAVRPLLREL